MSDLLIITPDAEEFRHYIAAALPDLSIEIARLDNPAATRALAREAETLLAWKFPPDLLAEAPRLRWVMSYGAGVDHLVDLNIPPGVTITRVVDAFGPAMAEHALGYLFAATLDLRRALAQQ